MLAGVVGDSQGDQFGVLTPVPDQIVAQAFFADQLGKQRDHRRIGRRAPGVGLEAGEDVEQLLATPQELPQTLQVIGQTNAGAVSGGILAHSLDHVQALAVENPQVTVVGVFRDRLAPIMRVGFDVGRGLPVLRDEGRFIVLERRV